MNIKTNQQIFALKQSSGIFDEDALCMHDATGTSQLEILIQKSTYITLKSINCHFQGVNGRKTIKHQKILEMIQLGDNFIDRQFKNSFSKKKLLK